MKTFIALILLLALLYSSSAADVTITIPDPQVTRVLDAVASQKGWTGLNPQGGAETKAQFAKRILKEYVVEIVKAAEGNAAAVSARTTANAAVDSIGIN